MANPIEFDATAAKSENAPVGAKLLNEIVPLFNEFVEEHNKFLANTNTSEAEKAYIENPTDEKDKAKAEKIRQAKALIEKFTAELAESAKDKVKTDANFDEAKAKASLNDKKVVLREKGNTLKDTFEMLSLIKANDTTPSGRKSNWTGVDKDGYGDMLLQVLDNIPRKVDANSSDDDKDSPQAIAKREVRKNAKEWGKKNGYKVADKGQLSSDLLEKYLAEFPEEQKKWDNASK